MQTKKYKILKQKALEMRSKEMSYSQIKEVLGLNKSTLSGWLSEFPLSNERINKLRANSAQRIEKFRNTMKKKDDAKKDLAYIEISKRIGKLSERDIFIGGLFLYWGEGGKTSKTSITFSNTNPDMIISFINWLKILGVSKDKLKIKIHIYSDMNKDKQIKYWSDILKIPKKQFNKPYIKKSKIAFLTYKNGYGQGTCNIVYCNRYITDLVMMGIKRISELMS